MQLPAALEEKFTTLLGRYPVKRSALIPMMMYAQDNFGSLSDELLADIAQRLDLNSLHQHFLHVARRKRTVRARAETPGDRQ